jgi:glycosyltransferase involved in cell wall biosynthesis
MYFLGIARRISGDCRVRFVFPRGTDAQFVGFCEAAGISYELLDRHADLGPAPGPARKLKRHCRKLRSEFEMVRFLLLRAGPRTVFHVELAPWQSLSAIAVLALFHPVFSTMHNRLPEVGGLRSALWRLKFGILSLFRGFRLFPSNRDARESLSSIAPRRIVERSLVTYTNVDPDEVGRALECPCDVVAERARFGIAAEAFVVLTVGQFIDRKGRWETVEAARVLGSESNPPVFVWVTNTDVPAADLEHVESAGKGGRFRLVRSSDIGPSHLDLMRFLRIADAFALPSHVEGLPISLLEAMAMGIPSISTGVNAIPEAVTDSETGLLVPPRDVGALAEAVRRLQGDARLRERIAAGGRRKVLAEFVETEVSAIALAAYRDSLGGAA